MKAVAYVILVLVALFGLLSCENEAKREAKLPHYHKYVRVEMPKSSLYQMQAVYVPVYSDIYHIDDARKFPLTVTLSIRNTNLSDSLYLYEVDFYDTYGKIQKSFNLETILLRPLESAEFVIEEKDDLGGSGANFIVNWGSMKTVNKPVIQAVMISSSGQQGMSFVTEGVTLERY